MTAFVDPVDGIWEAVAALRDVVALNDNPEALSETYLLAKFEPRLRSIAMAAKYAAGPCSCSAGMTCESTVAAFNVADPHWRQMILEMQSVQALLLAQLVQHTGESAEVFLRAVEEQSRLTAQLREAGETDG